MATHYQPPDPRKSRLPAILLGALTTLVIFVTLSLTKILAEFEKEKDLVEAPSVAPPPPPEPVEEEPPPPEPEPEELPEMEQPEPRQLSLAQLDIALNTGPGSLAGDFTMPDIDANQDALGSTDLFSLDALDQRPRPISRPSPIYPPELQRRGISGRVKVYFVINEQGKVTTRPPRTR